MRQPAPAIQWAGRDAAPCMEGAARYLAVYSSPKPVTNLGPNHRRVVTHLGDKNARFAVLAIRADRAGMGVPALVFKSHLKGRRQWIRMPKGY